MLIFIYNIVVFIVLKWRVDTGAKSWKCTKQQQQQAYTTTGIFLLYSYTHISIFCSNFVISMSTITGEHDALHRTD